MARGAVMCSVFGGHALAAREVDRGPRQPPDSGPTGGHPPRAAHNGPGGRAGLRFAGNSTAATGGQARPGLFAKLSFSARGRAPFSSSSPARAYESKEQALPGRDPGPDVAPAATSRLGSGAGAASVGGQSHIRARKSVCTIISEKGEEQGSKVRGPSVHTRSDSDSLTVSPFDLAAVS
jgi:hypothetical protein